MPPPSDPFKDLRIVSTYTPWFRRFGSEKKRELQEAQRLFDQVLEHHRASNLSAEATAKRITERMRRLPLGPYLDPFAEGIFRLVAEEDYIFDLPVFEGATMKEFAQYVNFLQKKLRFFEAKDSTLELIEGFVAGLFNYLAQDLPDENVPSPFNVPLVYALKNPREVVQDIYAFFAEEPWRERQMFHRTRERLNENIFSHSGIPREGPWGTKRLDEPIDSDLALDEFIDVYLQGTVFHRILNLPVPLQLSRKDRFAHTHVLGATGAGKTTLLENLIAFDLESDDPPSLVVIDSHGSLIPKLARLNLKRRVVLIDPEDISHPPALNLFDVKRTDDPVEREKVFAGVVDMFGYIFREEDTRLTGKQDMVFQYLCRLMLALPETHGRAATLKDLFDFLRDPAPFAATEKTLSSTAQDFFRDFHDPRSADYRHTAGHLRYRLHTILGNPTLERLFSAPHTKLDIATELDRGSIILVDTALDFLKGASSIFGKIFVALVLQAARERAAVPEDQRKHTFLYIDECHEYFSENIDFLLTEARKFKVGCVFAHQVLQRASSALRASLAQTGIKLVGGATSDDAYALAADMRVRPQFLLNVPRHQFAAYVRGATPAAVVVQPAKEPFARYPRRSGEEYDAFLDENRARVAYRFDEPSARVSPLTATPRFEADVSDD